ncbi:MAG TPA: hypothetical protein VLA12_02120 [Planctomycetaceae bacterium]|nr:hypothetical protein [Planctomycetaceae bacterium]
MPFTLTDIMLGVALPAAVSLTLVVLIAKLGKWLSVRLAAAPIALVAGFEAGYWSLSLGPIVPESNRHWLPYLVAVAAIVQIIAQPLGKSTLRQTIVLLLFAVGCGFLLIPAWDDLSPARPVYLIVWPLIVAAAGACGQRKLESEGDAERRYAGFVICLVFLTSSILLALAGSLSFAQIGLAMFGSSTGLLLAIVFKLSRESLALTNFPVAIALCGLLLIGRIYLLSEVPIISYLLIPAATVSFCLAGSKTLEHRCGSKKWLISGAFAILLCLSSLGIAALSAMGSD